MAAVTALWETLKHAVQAYTGMSAPTFFTVVALAAAFYYGLSAMFAPPPPPPVVMREVVEPLPPPVQLGEVSEEELRAYDGSDPKKPLLMAIKGQIYDVTQSRMFYGPGGPYALFAGKDASRALAKMSFEPKDLTGDISGLGPFELEALQDWEYKFMSKYEKVGTVKTVPVSDGPSDDSSEETAKATASTDGVETQPDQQKEESTRDVDVVAEKSAELRKDEVQSHNDETKDTNKASEDWPLEAEHPANE